MFPLYREGYGSYQVVVYESYIHVAEAFEAALKDAEEKSKVNRTIIEHINPMPDGKVQVMFRKKLVTPRTPQETLQQDGKVCVTLDEFKILQDSELNFQ